jgi:energy-coupling factor transport system substrate-specific component
VSWQLVSFLILAAVLIAGFAWYERSRPPAQIIALVAALAALAIAGRIAFAAFPNVKPTTDIVVFAGYALGGAPGFAVGALTALISNLWFGQGPWTPWQMAGWGMCGLLGAWLALGTRNIGRFGLAAVCGFAGIAYGALLNFSLMATYGGDLSWQRFVLYEGRAVPFDAAHAIGNIVFALIAGPAMIRMLVRFRRRFEWRRGSGEDPAGGAPPLRPAIRGAGAATLVLILAALSVSIPSPSSARAAGVPSATTWLIAQQNADGGFGASPGEDSGAEITCWAMLGLEAAGRNPLDVSTAGKTPVDYLRATVDQETSPGDLSRTVLALEGAGVDPRNFGGRNLIQDLLDRRRSNGSYEGWPNSTAFAIIALRQAGVAGGLEGSADWLRKVQGEDGGWGDVAGSPSTADTTAAVLQALAPGSQASQRALTYLRGVVRPGGGFSLGGNGPVNSQSTAWAIQGILAAGASVANFKSGGKTPLDYLADHQSSDGHYRYSSSSDQTPIWVTSEAITAAAKKPFPISPPPREPTSSPSGVSPGTPIEPSTIAPSIPLPESTPSSPSESAGSGVGSSPNVLRPPGEEAPGASAAAGPPGGRERGGPDTAADPEATASSPTLEPADKESNDGGDSSPAVAILAGLALGGVLFASGFAVFKRWTYAHGGA